MPLSIAPKDGIKAIENKRKRKKYSLFIFQKYKKKYPPKGGYLIYNKTIYTD